MEPLDRLARRRCTGGCGGGWRAPLGRAVRGWAAGRRGVDSRGGSQPDFQNCYYFLQSLGRRWRDIGGRLLVLVLLKVLKDHERCCWRSTTPPPNATDPKCRGGHPPRPHAGADRQTFCYGHVWVTLAVVVRHRLWGTIGLPIYSWLYVRRRDVPKLRSVAAGCSRPSSNKRPTWSSRACHNPCRPTAKRWVRGRRLRQAARSRPLLKAGVDARRPAPQGCAPHDLPPVQKTKRRGRPRTYGLESPLPGERAAHPSRLWSRRPSRCTAREVVNRPRRSWRRTPRVWRNDPGGDRRGADGAAVLLLLGRGWRGEIIECADRAAIEQVFHDVKEVWGSGQQQVRNLWANIAAWHVNLWLYTLVEPWAWDRPAAELVHREDSPWDRADRRVRATPTAAKALQAACLTQEFSTAQLPRPAHRKFRTLTNTPAPHHCLTPGVFQKVQCERERLQIPQHHPSQ
ncbi:MAG: hypothetical protein R3B90_15945 [Planctomycetaceae bacterium]